MAAHSSSLSSRSGRSAFVCCGQPTLSGSTCRRRGKVPGFRCYAHNVPGAAEKPVAVEKFAIEEADICPICLDEVAPADDAALLCNHTIHLSCFSQLHQAMCPLCRRPIEKPEGHVSSEIVNMILSLQGQNKDTVVRLEVLSRQMIRSLQAKRAIATSSDLREARQDLEALMNRIKTLRRDQPDPRTLDSLRTEIYTYYKSL